MKKSDLHRTSNDGVRWWARQDATLALATLAAEHAHIAILTPPAAPAVLHLPVVFAVVSSVTNGKNTMVEAGATESTHNSFGVQLEDCLSIHGHRHRSGCHSFHQCLLSTIHIHETTHFTSFQANSAARC